MIHNSIDFKQDIFGTTRDYFIKNKIQISNLKNKF
jgi:hypothetical protein